VCIWQTIKYYLVTKQFFLIGYAIIQLPDFLLFLYKSLTKPEHHGISDISIMPQLQNENTLLLTRVKKLEEDMKRVLENSMR
jgi:hypothetical protein